MLLSAYQRSNHLTDFSLEERFRFPLDLVGIAPQASRIVFQMGRTKRYGWVSLHVAKGGLFTTNDVASQPICNAWDVNVR